MGSCRRCGCKKQPKPAGEMTGGESSKLLARGKSLMMLRADEQITVLPSGLKYPRIPEMDLGEAL
jgi:hypothetical protein